MFTTDTFITITTSQGTSYGTLAALTEYMGEADWDRLAVLADEHDDEEWDLYSPDATVEDLSRFFDGTVTVWRLDEAAERFGWHDGDQAVWA